MKKFFWMIFILLLSSGYCFAEKKEIYVSILPQKYFVEQIAKDKVNVHVMVLPGHSPATYNPKPAQMSLLSKADMYFSIGVPFEQRWLPKIQNTFKDLIISDCSRNIFKKTPDKLFFDEINSDHDDHDNEDHHDHGFYDPHIWMSPVNAVKISRNILTSLSEIDPENMEFYENNYKSFIKEVADLDVELMKIFSKTKNKNIFVFHPSWGYLFGDYGLKQIPIEVEGKEPGPKHISKLMLFAKKHNINMLLVQPQFPSSSVNVMEQTLGLKVYRADPLAYEWKENILSAAKLIQK